MSTDDFYPDILMRAKSHWKQNYPDEINPLRKVIAAVFPDMEIGSKEYLVCETMFVMGYTQGILDAIHV